MPGHAARAAFRYKLIEDWGGYDQTLEISEIGEYARTWNNETPYSKHIRESPRFPA